MRNIKCWSGSRQDRQITDKLKQQTIKFTENISDNFWIHETQNGINRYLNFGQLKHHRCTLNIQ